MRDMENKSSQRFLKLFTIEADQILAISLVEVVTLEKLPIAKI